MLATAMQECFDSKFYTKITENTVWEYNTSRKALLDLNFKIANLRSASEKEIIDLFMKAFYEDRLIAIKWLFWLRDPRIGVGERRIFRVILKYLCDSNPEVMAKLIQYIPEFGRYDDLWCILDTQLSNNVITMIHKQLAEDESNMKDGFNVSLLAKWMPSTNASSKKTIARARQLRIQLGMNEERYRKLLSALRKYLHVVEVKMSSKSWEQINYEQVPAIANRIYNNSFLRNDEERRLAYLRPFLSAKGTNRE